MFGDRTAERTTNAGRVPWADAALLFAMSACMVVGGAQRVAASTFWPSGDSTFHLQNIFAVHHFLSKFSWGPLPYNAYPPGFYILTHVCLALFGDSLESVAIAQACAGSALIVIAYFAARDLGGRLSGLLAAAAIFGNIQIVDAVHQVYLDLPASAPFLLTVWALAQAPALDSRKWTLVAAAGVATTILVRAGALPFLGLAVAYALLQALCPKHWLAVLISTASAGLLALRLSGQGKTENNGLVPAAVDWAAHHQAAFQWGGPILGVALVALGLWVLRREASFSRRMVPALASGSIILGATITILCGYFASYLPDMREYTRISLFTEDHMDFGHALPRIPWTFAVTALSIPVAALAALESTWSIFAPSRAQTRIYAAAVVTGLAFVLAATDNWTRYATPLIAPACVLAGAAVRPFGRLAVVPLLAALAQGGWIWFGWHWDTTPGFSTFIARGQPRLEIEAPEPLHWYGYAGQTEWPLSFPPETAPFLMEDIYDALYARGDIDRCSEILFTDYWQSVEVRDFNYLLVRDDRGADAAIINPADPPEPGACAVVVAFDNPNMDLTTSPPDFDAMVAAIAAQCGLPAGAEFDVKGHKTRTFLWSGTNRQGAGSPGAPPPNTTLPGPP